MDKQMLFDLMVLLGTLPANNTEERNLTMINQNQEAETTLDDTKQKLKAEIEKREFEVKKYKENMEFLDNQSKAQSVVDAPTMASYKPGFDFQK